MAVASVATGGVVLNLIDTPGYPDFVGELRAGLRAADAALFVVSASDGVDAATRALWQECAALGTPRAVAVTKLDVARADIEGTVAAVPGGVRRGRDAALPAGPLRRRPSTGNLGLLTRQVYACTGGERVLTAAGPEHEALLETHRGALIEAIIQESEDDTLLDRYLGGEEVDVDTVIADLLTAVCRGAFYPVVPVSTESGVGLGELLHLFAAAFPPPTDRPLPTAMTPAGRALPPLRCDPDAPAGRGGGAHDQRPVRRRGSASSACSAARCAPTRWCTCPATSPASPGTRSRGTATTTRTSASGRSSSPLGDALRPKPEALAGDLCVVAKLSRAETDGHPQQQGLPRRRRAVGAARPAAARRDPRRDQVRRGQARRRAAAAGGRGPDDAAGAQRRDPPGRALDDGPGPRRRRCSSGCASATP